MKWFNGILLKYTFKYFSIERLKGLVFSMVRVESLHILVFVLVVVWS